MIRQSLAWRYLLATIWVCTAAMAAEPNDAITLDIVTITAVNQHETVSPDSNSAIAVHLQTADNWHFYASKETAPGGMNLKVTADANGPVRFREPVFPESHLYYDKSLQQQLQVYSGDFKVFLPFTVEDITLDPNQIQTVPVTIAIEGAVCSDVQCRVPDFGTLAAVITIKPHKTEPRPQPSAFEVPEPPNEPNLAVTAGPTDTQSQQWASLSLWAALLTALAAGLLLNLMPCVWPVLPIVVMRVVKQAEDKKSKPVTMALVFCLGIISFFAALAILNIVLQLFFGTVMQWGDQFRSPVFVSGMVILLVVLALFMFGLFNLTLPSSVTGKTTSGSGYAGTYGMGFLAAILSTPCSFGILAAAFAWAQAQNLALATIAILCIGIGMAFPYAILMSMPKLLQKMPRAGQWMETFKQAVGFIFLGIAAWLFAAVPDKLQMSVLYFAVVISTGIWIWSSWVTHNTPITRKIIIRLIALALVVAAGVYLFRPEKKPIDWQPYDAAEIQAAIDNGQPVLIKFDAEWCLSCKWVATHVYGDKQLADLLKDKNVLTIRGDTTARDYPAAKALKNVYNEPGVPVSILHIPAKDEPIRYRGKDFADDLKEVLLDL